MGSHVWYAEKPDGWLYFTVCADKAAEGVHLTIEQTIALRDSLNKLPLEEALKNHRARNGAPPPSMRLPDGLLKDPEPSN